MRFFKRHKTTLLSLLAAFLFSVTVTFAVPPSSPYTSGQTLDPQCVPGAANCTVAVLAAGAPIGGTTASSVLFTDANNQLTSNGTVSITQGGTGGATAQAARANLGLSYATASDIAGTDAVIAAWGDSLTASTGGQTSYTRQLATLTGYTIFNGGIGGETSTQIRDRMLAATERRGQPTIIWAGRNNYADAATVKSDIAAMVASLTTTNYLVLSIINSTTFGVGTPGYDQIIALNNDLAATYGSHYIDIRAYLVSQYNPSIPQDVTDYANDVPPTSLHVSGDTLHLNSAGYFKVAQRIQQSLSVLGISPVNGAAVLTPANIANIFAGGRSSIDLAVGGGYSIGTTRILYLPDQTVYPGTIALGTGGNKLMRTGGANDGVENTFAGVSVGNSNTTGYQNVGVGYTALTYTDTGYRNTAVGTGGLQQNTSGYQNVALGYGSLGNNTSGSNNTAIGTSALSTGTTGINNVAIGYAALRSSTASSSVAIGYAASINNTTGTSSVAIGTNALFGNATGGRNVVIGRDAGLGVASSSNVSNNVFVGYRSGFATLTGANLNTLIGYQTGYALTTGIRNIYLGSYNVETNANITTGSNNIIIGNDIQAFSATASNQLNVGNLIFGTGLSGTGTTIAGNIGIGLADNISARLEVKGTTSDSTASAFEAWSSGNASLFKVRNDGNVGISNTTPTVLFHVGSASTTTGTTVARFQNAGGTCDIVPSTSGGVTCSSDMTLKKNITMLSDDSSWSFSGNISPDNQSILSKVLTLAPVRYNWNVESDTNAKHAGFIAQEVQQVFPDLVSTDHQTGLLSLNYSGLIPYTVQAIREMDLNITDISNLDRPNTWRESLIAWLGDAGNGIRSLVVKDKICVDDQCLTRDDIQRLLQDSDGQQGSQIPAPSVPSTPEAQEGGEQTPAVEEIVVETPAEETVTPPAESEPAPESTESAL